MGLLIAGLCGCLICGGLAFFYYRVFTRRRQVAHAADLEDPLRPEIEQVRLEATSSMMTSSMFLNERSSTCASLPLAPSKNMLPADLPMDFPSVHLKLDEFIGLGGQAYVFTCTHRGKRCAAKVFDLGKAREAQSDPIDAEVQTFAKLGSHPNIVEFLGDFQVDPYRLIVMELLSGGSLDDQVFRGGARMREAEARYVFRQLLSAIGHIHAQGLLHRDLKLKNVLVASSKPVPGCGILHEVKVIDFGLCKSCPDANSHVGTDLFAAPEVGSKEYDFAVDYWSLGVILFCCLCQHYPVQDPDRLGRPLQATLDAGALLEPSLSSPWAGLTEEAKRLIRGLLTVEWDPWYGRRARYSLEECWRSPWVDSSQSPEWPGSGQMPQLPCRAGTSWRIPLQRVLVSRPEAEGCMLGSLEDVKRGKRHFDEKCVDKCLDVGRRFGTQVVYLQRTESDEAWLDGCKPEAVTELRQGDVLFYARRRIEPTAELHLDSGVLPEHGEFEQLCTEDSRSVRPAVLDCYSVAVPEWWDNCVLGGAKQAGEGQGFLDLRQNCGKLTVAAIVPGSGDRATVHFPGGSDAVHRGDTLLFPRRVKELSDDASPLTGREREAIEDMSRKLKRAVQGKAFTDEALFDRWCQKQMAGRAPQGLSGPSPAELELDS